jgi:hypothetical protein
MTSRSHLVAEHLENVSGKVFDAYPEIIREMIKGKSGVYALYRRGSLYCVGLASNLSGRLKNHDGIDTAACGIASVSTLPCVMSI